MALAKRIGELTRATSHNRLHLELLQGFVDHGKDATSAQTVGFLQHLRKTRDGIVSKINNKKDRLQKWEKEIKQHEGFAQVREQLLPEEGLKSLSDADLSRAYNLLRRMNFAPEAESVWTVVSSRLASGEITAAPALLGLWSVAPAERLADLDAPLAAVVSAGGLRTWQLLSAVSRASERPASLAVQKSAKALGQQLADLSSDDLALMCAQLGSRLRDGSDKESQTLQALAKRAKAELVSRDGALETHQLLGLLGCLEGTQDGLWPMIRKQLLTKKDLSVPQAVDVCRLIHDAGGSADHSLFGGCVQQIRKQLNASAEPGYVALVARNLDMLATQKACLFALFNSAFRLRKDLFPTVLWALFVKASEADILRRHPDLQARLQQIGELLENHPIKRQKMLLREMAGAAEAMCVNNIVLRKSLTQMSEQFVLIHAEVLKRGSAGDDVEEEKKPVSKPVGLAETNWLSEVQRLMLEFWLKLNALGVDEPELTSTLDSFLGEPGDCQIEALALPPLASSLGSASGDDAERFHAAVVAQLATRLPQLDNPNIVEVARHANSVELRRAVVDEVGRRVSKVLHLKKGADLDDMMAILSCWAAWTEDSGSRSGLVQQIMDLVTESLPAIARQEPELARPRLLAAVRAFSSGTPFEEVGLPHALRAGLHLEGGTSEPWDLQDAADLAFGYALLSEGVLPLDVAGRIWRIIGDSLTKGSDGADSDLSPEHAAKMRAFGLVILRSSAPTLAALRMATEGARVEEFLNGLERGGKAVFDTAGGPTAAATVERVRHLLPEALAGEACEERFVVPGTPYVADFAFVGRQVLLMVPQVPRRAAEDRPSGTARCAELALEGLGWRVCWLWQDEWRADVEADGNNSAAVLQRMVGVEVGEPKASNDVAQPESGESSKSSDDADQLKSS